MPNTLSTHTLRQLYVKSSLNKAVRNALVSERVFIHDTRDLKTLENPYITNQTAAIQAVAGTYTVTAMTTTDDTLTVADEVVANTHVFDFEKKTANFNLMADFLDDLTYSVMFKVDQFVLNKILDQATGTYSTPSGGFTNPANILEIFANLQSKVDGYEGNIAAKPFIVLESTDVVGLLQLQASAGFNYADRALNGGRIGNLMGVEIYVIRTGTFVTTTLGTLSATNLNHRLFGITNTATFATPGGVHLEEKGVTQKLGTEIAVAQYVGANLWVPMRGLFVDITIV